MVLIITNSIRSLGGENQAVNFFFKLFCLSIVNVETIDLYNVEAYIEHDVLPTNP